MDSFQKEWQVEAQGQIFEADFDELRVWIEEGAVLPSDKVRRGSLRWLPAEKVPELYNFFNSIDFEPSSSVVVTTTDFLQTGEPPFVYDPHLPVEYSEEVDQAPLLNAEIDSKEQEMEFEFGRFCSLHEELEAVYACDICKHSFCKTCPKSFGSSVKICPVCGAMCRGFDEPPDVHNTIGAINKPYVKIVDADQQTRNSGQISDTLKAFFHFTNIILATVLFAIISGIGLFIYLMS